LPIGSMLALPFYRNTLIGDLVFGWGWVLVKTLLSNIRLNVLAVKA